MLHARVTRLTTYFVFSFCESITFGSWSKHDEHIGAVELPPDVNPADFVGSEKETRYVSCFLHHLCVILEQSFSKCCLLLSTV